MPKSHIVIPPQAPCCYDAQHSDKDVWVTRAVKAGELQVLSQSILGFGVHSLGKEVWGLKVLA